LSPTLWDTATRATAATSHTLKMTNLRPTQNPANPYKTLVTDDHLRS
jgi:hypothetical protein